MLFLLAYGKRYVNGFCNQFGEPRRADSEPCSSRPPGGAGPGCSARCCSPSFTGTVVAVTAWWLDLPAAVSLGVLVGLLSTLPLIGVLVGGVPAALLALGFDGWPTALVVGAVLLASSSSRRSSTARGWSVVRSGSGRRSRSSSGCSGSSCTGWAGRSTASRWP